MFEHFTDKAIRAIMLAQEEARRTGHNLVGTEQLLLGIIAEGTSLGTIILAEMGISLKIARQAVQKAIGRGGGYAPANIPFTPKTKRIFEQSFQESRQLGNNYIAPEHLLLALTKEDESVAAKVLEQLQIDRAEVRNEIIRRSGEINSSSQETATAGRSQQRPGFGFGGGSQPSNKLENYSVNLTQRAREGKIDPVIGREKEVERTVQILGRRTKNNPILVGEPGVGKTAIAEGLAQRIVTGEIPELLKEKEIISLDMGLLIAGTRFRGDFEERLKAIVEEVRKSDNIILVIDEIHTLIGAGGVEGGMDAANLLKPALARGEFQCVGTTTVDEYRKHIEKDAALERRFQMVKVGEPSVEETIEILYGLRQAYADHHKVEITDEALKAAANLSHQYISDRFLPDKAIDLIDEAGSRIHLRHSLSEKIEAGIEVETDEKFDAVIPAIVDEEEIAHIVSTWTGVPVNKLTKPEAELLMHMEDTLHERLIGQEDAVQAVSRAIRRARVGLKSPKKPIASFMFCGPTGVGKTELTKALATYLFGSVDATIRIDMSEYMERHTVSKLIGSPPGFIGYDEGGQLTEAVRRRPYSVILFDEIEKAHPDVFNLMLQLLDEGRLTDAQGREVNFRNTLIIMTSNIGSRAIEKAGSGFGFESSGNETDAKYNRIRNLVMDDLKNYFRPEFINRLDDVIVFRQLTKPEVTEIADILLKEVRDRLFQERQIRLEVSDSFKDLVVTQGYDPSYGARPLRRAIMRNLEDPLAEAILSGEVNSQETATVDIDENGQVVVKSTEKQELQLVG